MAKNDLIELDGIITQVCPGARFRVKPVNDEGEELDMAELFCTLTGKLRQNHIKIVNGDKVTVKVSPYDLTKGIIAWRHK